MSVAEKLERLARLVPGVGGYQDRERSRETDKTVRERLAGRLESLKREIEVEQQRLTRGGVLDHLDDLGRLGAKLDRLANEIRYASRGYRGFFDDHELTQETLQRICEFDLRLFDELAGLREEIERMRVGYGEAAAYEAAIRSTDDALDRFGTVFEGRAEVFVSR